MQRFFAFVASGFGLGFSPVAPGTAGCLLGLPLAWLINTQLGVPGQVAAAVALSLLAIPLCQAAEDVYGGKDPKACVADEYLTFPLCMIGLPVAGQPGGLLMMAIAFVSNRFFDIAKIWPAHGLQRLKGGLGITIDDVFAALYALVANHLAYRALQHLGWI